MSGRLRHIALTVEQPERNSYAWLLIESAGGKVFVLKRAARSHRSYLSALDEGYEELALMSACGLHERGIEYRAPAANESAVLELAGLHDAP